MTGNGVLLDENLNELSNITFFHKYESLERYLQINSTCCSKISNFSFHGKEILMSINNIGITIILKFIDWLI